MPVFCILSLLFSAKSQTLELKFRRKNVVMLFSWLHWIRTVFIPTLYVS